MSSKEYEKSYQLPWNILNVLLQPTGEKIGSIRYVSQFEFAAVCCSRPMQNILTCRFAELIAQTHPQQRHLQKERPFAFQSKVMEIITLVNYAVVLLLVVVSSMAGWTAGGYQTATPPPYYTTTYATISYYTQVALLGLQLNHQGSRLLHHNLCCSSSYTTKTLKYYTEAPKYYTTMASETTQLRMLPQPTTPRLQLIAPPKLSEYYTGAPKYDRSQSSELLRHPTRQPRSFE
ncbi:hypothetical protein DAPPUDRAFT_241498 [Daphnia pulex]|uniref:Uncharacterized protein n=1 Tax=Daphnia pulex TaxID=6669 RepID=E9GEE6_DAPPU|nr:hypothetical protein DAPPUDRAFT_241498 [Daphnia pulex]|eukprot:EFX82326.1 hypothetical protein DAPPUDRAFT_241498 [Daphnia pulex]